MADLQSLFDLDVFDQVVTSESGRVDRGEAARVLRQAYDSRSGEEALFRSLEHERQGKLTDALFWLQVYVEIKHVEQAA